MKVLGIDIGGSSIKGAPVDISTGTLTEKIYEIPTPLPAKPDPVGNVVGNIAGFFKWKRPIGVTFPAVIKDGVAFSAANVDKSWIGYNGEELFRKMTGCPVRLLNDADAAGIAEMEFGAGKGHNGVVIVLTLGTGIGSAIFADGRLVPNTEFGHMEIRGKDAEHRAAARIRTEEELTWEEWAACLEEFLERMEVLFSPDLFIIGGGVSTNQEKFLPLLHTRAGIFPAKMRNEAGIIGAAFSAKDLL